MGLKDTTSAAADKVTGAAKEKIGAVIGHPELQAEGQAQSAVGHAKKTGQSPEETAREITDDTK